MNFDENLVIVLYLDINKIFINFSYNWAYMCHAYDWKFHILKLTQWFPYCSSLYQKSIYWFICVMMMMMKNKMMTMMITMMMMMTMTRMKMMMMKIIMMMIRIRMMIMMVMVMVVMMNMLMKMMMMMMMMMMWWQDLYLGLH